MAYVLIEAAEPSELTDKVNELMREGWVLYGYPLVSNAIELEAGENDCLVTKYLQAMVCGRDRGNTE